ncbi:MAG: hypothetical protein ACI8P9_004967, partial [Parasphingorhabdus sp.]
SARAESEGACSRCLNKLSSSDSHNILLLKIDCGNAFSYYITPF